MSAEIEKRVKELGYDIPVAAAPAANYVPFVISGNLLHISGQLPMLDGKLAVTGHLGRDVDVAGGQKAAELCALGLLAQAKAALGDAGKHARAAVGMAALPLNAAVEIDAIMEIA